MSCGKFGEQTYAYRVLVVKPEGKRSPVNHRCRREENITVFRKEIVWEGVDWIEVIRI
jgi:hypothetical protein